MPFNMDTSVDETPTTDNSTPAAVDQIDSNLFDFNNFHLENVTSSNASHLGTALANIRSLLVVHDEQTLQKVAREINFDILTGLVSGEFMKKLQGILGRTHRETFKADALAVFKRCMGAHTPLEAIERLRPYILASHTHEIEEVQAACMEQIFRLSMHDEHYKWIAGEPEILSLTVQQIGSPFISVYMLSMKTITNLVQRDVDSLDWLFNDSNMFHVKQIQQKNSINFFRVAEIFAELVALNSNMIAQCSQHGVFDELFSTLQSNDVLSQLNCLEMLTQIATSGGGVCTEFVSSRGAFKWMNKVLQSNDDPMNLFILPGAIKFFGSVAHHDPDYMLTHHISALQCILGHLDCRDADVSVTVLAAETFCFLASSGMALRWMWSADGEGTKRACKALSEFVRSPNRELSLRQRVLESMTGLFVHHRKSNVSKMSSNTESDYTELSSVCESLYRSLHSTPLETLLTVARQPISEMKYAAFRLLHQLAGFSWFEQQIVLSAGFLEFLLDRKTETEMDGHHLKYDIICRLVDSDTCKDNLGAPGHMQLLVYQKQGALYAESQVAVAYGQEE